MQNLSFELSYLESDPRTQQPSACVYLMARGTQDYAGIEAEKLVSAPCLTYVEFDAELRRLYAELDEIRARAKKKFYRAESKAMAMAAGAS
jgi:hypothetical protein